MQREQEENKVDDDHSASEDEDEDYVDELPDAQLKKKEGT